jgi:hypothetical protein
MNNVQWWIQQAMFNEQYTNKYCCQSSFPDVGLGLDEIHDVECRTWGLWNNVSRKLFSLLEQSLVLSMVLSEYGTISLKVRADFYPNHYSEIKDTDELPIFACGINRQQYYLY